MNVTVTMNAKPSHANSLRHKGCSAMTLTESVSWNCFLHSIWVFQDPELDVCIYVLFVHTIIMIMSCRRLGMHATIRFSTKACIKLHAHSHRSTMSWLSSYHLTLVLKSQSVTHTSLEACAWCRWFIRHWAQSWVWDTTVSLLSQSCFFGVDF